MACMNEHCDDESIHEAWTALSSYLALRSRETGAILGGSGPRMGELVAVHPEWVSGLIEATRRHIAPLDLLFGANLDEIEELVRLHPIRLGESQP